MFFFSSLELKVVFFFQINLQPESSISFFRYGQTASSMFFSNQYNSTLFLFNNYALKLWTSLSMTELVASVMVDLCLAIVHWSYELLGIGQDLFKGTGLSCSLFLIVNTLLLFCRYQEINSWGWKSVSCSEIITAKHILYSTFYQLVVQYFPSFYC